MRLETIILEGFRGYTDRVRIPISPLTAFVGRNDAGKSTILEALDVFFNGVKCDPADLCVQATSKILRVGCEFSGFPDSHVLDAAASTNLRSEFLVNDQGYLEIHKTFDCSLKSPKEAILAVALHPSGEPYHDMLLKKNAELKATLRDSGIPESSVDLRSNVALRTAIWSHRPTQDFATSEIPLDKEDDKKIWDQLKHYPPLYGLFKSDRPSQDGDTEVQPSQVCRGRGDQGCGKRTGCH